MTNWPELAKELSAQLRGLHDGVPEVMQAFSNIAQAALIALGISVAVRCDDCIAFHVKAALQQGASHEEVAETLGMAIYMGAGPSVMYASHAMQAFNQFAGAQTKEPASAAAR